MKKIGLGIQELSKFKDQNLIYVDKTETIHRLISEGSYYFLSRPRRFGKSLLVNTMLELFQGNKELFEECWIYDQWNWDDQFPVLKIDFTRIQYQELGLKKAIDKYLTKLAIDQGIQLESEVYSEKFLELIQKLGETKPVVILIDEYDKPIIDYLERSATKQAEENRSILKTFYAGVKDLDKYIRFFFLTGVSKFSRVSIFSDLNHLTDITVFDDFSQIVGYSLAEMERYYSTYLDAAAEKYKLSRSQLLDRVKDWYDGYSWDGENFLYNPYSVLSFFKAKAFKNFWFETGTPTFLIKKLKESNRKINQSINKAVDETVFNKYEIENLNITAIMFQTGYLTIKSFDLEKNRYLLDFPNKEVRESFLNFAVEHYVNSSSEQMEYIVDQLLEALHENDPESFFVELKALFSSITVKQLDKVKEYEGFYHSIIFIVLKILGIHVGCEVQSSFGTTDAIIKTDETIYVIEFKMGTAEAALKQIKKKKYCDPYLADKREVVMIGFGIDKEERNLTDFLVEPI